MNLSWGVTQYTVGVIPVTGVPSFDYFFSLVFYVGAAGWFIGLPFRFFTDKG